PPGLAPCPTGRGGPQPDPDVLVSERRPVPDGPTLVLALAPDVTVAEADDGGSCLAGPQGTIALPAQPAGLVAAARALAAGGATEEQLAATFLAASETEQRGAAGGEVPS